ncbi:TPA: hypothetical protein DIS56_00125 [Candidatus Saccharibacteria bacterium]|nr:MAG: hypothetical protein A3F05_02410 [Candidatus Saccharibacteria bacterium RIFCSPHIGHO2_12_FULL_47_17]HCM51535.1 hypothetical protein [Candidatus Saccharibacteria bacterium]
METLFAGLAAVIAIGTGVALIMRRIGQPLLIGHIITGIIVGPALFKLIKSPETLSIFGDLGIALLLFIIGLGMSPRVIAEVVRPSITVASAQIAITTIIGWLVGSAFGLSSAEAFFVGLGFGLSSTIVALKLLSDKREQGRLYGKLTIGALVVEDVVAAIAIMFVASAHEGQWLAAGPLVSLAFKGLLIGAGMYWVSRYVLPHLQKLIAADQELLFLFAIAWGLGIAALFAKVGFSMEIGALAAGIFLAGLPYAQEIAARLRPLRDFFVVIFFIALGTQLSFSQLSDSVGLIIAGILIVVMLKPLIIMTGLGLLGYTRRTAFKTGLNLTQVSEFSIIFVILGYEKGLIEQHIVVLLTVVALISIAISTYLVTFSDRLYGLTEKHLHLFERRHTRHEHYPSSRYDFILFGYQKGGHEFVNVFKELKKSYVVVDYDPEVIETMEHRGINYLYGDATDIELLEEAGIERAKLIVSTITDFQTNLILLTHVETRNPEAVVICEAENPRQAAKLYRQGASYVILPHYIGSEKISAFVKKSGLKKSAFKKFRDQHLKLLEDEFGALDEEAEHDRKLGRAIVKGLTSLTSKSLL